MYKRKRVNEADPDEAYKFNNIPLPAQLILANRPPEVPAYKQEVLDEQGRQRLHGAFTGGFSAGYFNTVGSKEGWTPSTFKSSRTNRAAAVQARPQDFMDDEDLDDGGEEEEMEISSAYTGKGPVEAVIRLRKKGEDTAQSTSSLSLHEPTVFQHDRTDDTPTLKPVTKAAKVVRGGLGVGILNDNGEDEDVYEIKPKTSYDKILGGKKGKKGKKMDAAFEASKMSFKKVLADHTFVSKKDAKVVPKVVARSPSPPPPPVEDETMEVDAPVEKEKEVEKVPEKEMKPAPSVFAFMSAEARARIAAATGKSDLPEALGEVGPEGYISNAKQEDLIPYLEKDVAMNALKGGYLPYADDPDKRMRYRTFLEVKASVREGLPARKKGMLSEDWVKEMHEFAHAARIFKPISGMMASRFTSSATAAATSHTFQTNNASDWNSTDEVIVTYPTKKENPAEAAAKVGMFGPLTRSISVFIPSRLLCKRFNVRAPDISDEDDGRAAQNGGGQFGTQTGVSSKKDLELVGGKEMGQMMEEMRVRQNVERDAAETREKQEADRMRLEREKERTALENRGKEALTAIFGDDSDDE